MAQPHVLIVVTSHGLIEGIPRTGIWFSEFSEPYAALAAAGYDLTVASPLGAAAPVDPRSYPSRSDIAATHDPLWTQVLPEAHPGAMPEAIVAERSSVGKTP